MGDLCSPSPVPQLSSDTQELTARCQEATKLGILSRELRHPGRTPGVGDPVSLQVWTLSSEQEREEWSLKG